MHNYISERSGAQASVEKDFFIFHSPNNLVWYIILTQIKVKHKVNKEEIKINEVIKSK